MNRPSILIVSACALAMLTSCVSMSTRNLGTGRTVKITKEELKSKEVKTYNASEQPDEHSKVIMVKVLLAKSSGPLGVSSSGQASIADSSVAEGKKFVITALPDGFISINGDDTGKKLLEITCKDGYLVFNKKSYRGSFMVFLKSGTLMLVNKLELEQYLYGVLPSEVSYSWEKEVLKAQAVAARSFAIYNRLKNKTPEYDLDCSVASQVYSGRDVEAAPTNSAIDETAGEVLSYNGEVIQAFFHANSGGRTASSEEVWGGRHDLSAGRG